MEIERRTWLRGIWETMKAILLQKITTYHIRSSPLLLPSHLAGLNVIVTGTTSGIGYHTARELAMAGANVVMGCRNVDAANRIYEQWRTESQNGRALNVKVMELDLLSLSSVRQFAVEWDQLVKPLHILINNAGILRLRGRQQISDDGLEHHLQVNHVAPTLLTLLLLPSMLRATTSRVVHVNSLSHHVGIVGSNFLTSTIEEGNLFSGLKAYGTSKLAHIMFLKALGKKLLDLGWTSVHCVAVHPGIVTTNLAPEMKNKSFWRLEAYEGARSVLYCGTSDEVLDNMVEGFAYYSSNHKPGILSSKADQFEACLSVWESTLSFLGLNINYLSHIKV